MNRISCTVLFITISFALFGQKKISQQQAQEDFRIFENILKKGHPSLYEYISKSDLDSIFSVTKESLNKETTDIEVFKKMQQLTDHIKDGHLQLYAPNTMNTTQYYFPLILKIIQTEFYTDTDDFEIPIGSKILRINKKPTSQILEALKKYAPADGHNFNYLTPNGDEKSITLTSEQFVKAKHRNINRNSYFSNYHGQQDKVAFFSKHINSKEPFIYYKDHLQTAVLVVNSFGVDIRAFKTRISQLFKEVYKNKVKHLIIDIRNNDGGYRPNSVHLFSFIASKFFKQRVRASVSSLKIPEKKFATRNYGEKEFLRDKFYRHPTYDGWELIFDDLETMMVPNQNRFRGKIYVLAGGATFSAGSAFALLAKDDPNILLIGEETGGNYHFHTGQFPVHYKLPNSKITFVMSMEKIMHYIEDKTVPKGSGVIPNRTVLQTVEDLMKGTDSQLDYIFHLISG